MVQSIGTKILWHSRSPSDKEMQIKKYRHAQEWSLLQQILKQAMVQTAPLAQIMPEDLSKRWLIRLNQACATIHAREASSDWQYCLCLSQRYHTSQTRCLLLASLSHPTDWPDTAWGSSIPDPQPKNWSTLIPELILANLQLWLTLHGWYPKEVGVMVILYKAGQVAKSDMM